MTKEVLAVDIDEVLFPFVEEFVAFDNAIHGGDFGPADFKSYAFETVIDVSFDEVIQRVYNFCGSDHDHVQPLDRTKEALEDLSEKFDLTVVTARHQQFENNTHRWLGAHFKGVFSSVTHIGYAPVMEKPVKKIDICRDLGAIALIDDSISHVSECAEAGVEGILFGDYPWNQSDELPKNVTRCKDWTAVLEHFEERR